MLPSSGTESTRQTIATSSGRTHACSVLSPARKRPALSASMAVLDWWGFPKLEGGGGAWALHRMDVFVRVVHRALMQKLRGTTIAIDCLAITSLEPGREGAETKNPQKQPPPKSPLEHATFCISLHSFEASVTATSTALATDAIIVIKFLMVASPYTSKPSKRPYLRCAPCCQRG